MTDQRTLKEQAKTLAEIAVERKKWQEAFRDGAMGNQQAYAYARDTRFQYEQTSKWVLLSDAEAALNSAQSEIQQLKSSISYYNSEQARKLILELREQVEAAKTIAERSCNQDCEKVRCTFEGKCMTANIRKALEAKP